VLKYSGYLILSKVLFIFSCYPGSPIQIISINEHGQYVINSAFKKKLEPLNGGFGVITVVVSFLKLSSLKVKKSMRGENYCVNIYLISQD
jgi:hypothetical protein